DQLPHWLTQLGNWLPSARQSMMCLAEWLSLPRLSLRTILVVLALGFGLQLSYTAGSYTLAKSMGITISPVDWAAINAIVALVQILPLTIGGLGVREGLFAKILALYQIPVAQSTAVSLTGF